MSADVKLIDIDNIKPGDVLLCYGEGKIASKITQKTGSDYTHAAICYSSTEAVEAIPSPVKVVPGGVNKVAIADIITRYSHLAVFRQPDAWSDNRVKVMNLFLDEVIASKRKYNLEGFIKFAANKQNHELSLPDKLKAYFNDALQPDSCVKEKYFCSELVADCFVVTGFIDHSAAVIYKSDTYAPGDLGKDPTFGIFVGYLTSEDRSDIPANDEFIKCPTFAEIFGAGL